MATEGAYRFKAHPRASRVAVRVDPGGDVVVSVGRRVSRRRVAEFLAAHEKWIARTRGRMIAAAARHPPFPYPSPAARAAMRAWGARRLLDVAGPLAARYAAFTGRPAPRLRAGEFKTQWGSCSGDGRIALDWRLALAPPPLAEYVVAHEACHLAVPGHPPTFWTLLERMLPGAQARRGALRALSRDLARY